MNKEKFRVSLGLLFFAYAFALQNHYVMTLLVMAVGICSTVWLRLDRLEKNIESILIHMMLQISVLMMFGSIERDALLLILSVYNALFVVAWSDTYYVVDWTGVVGMYIVCVLMAMLLHDLHLLVVASVILLPYTISSKYVHDMQKKLEVSVNSL